MIDVDTRLYRELLDSVTDGIYFIDPHRRITFWNKSAETITGYTAEEMIGSSCSDNKLVHVPGRGWVPFFEALNLAQEAGSTRLGWRGGPKISDRPVIVTTSAEAKRLAAFTWGKSTYSLVCNPHHPCMHADPALPDLEPGESARIKGRVIFFEGSPGDFSSALEKGSIELPS